LKLSKALFATQPKEAVAQALECIKKNPKFEDGVLKKVILKYFLILGADHPIVKEARRKLANLIM
jgi:thioredoxin-like negative regulator of GroEL